MRFIIITLFCLLYNGIACAQRLELFTSESGKVLYNGIPEPVPYDKVISYYDIFIPNSNPDTILHGKKIYFLYFKLPVAVTEIGIRFISPVPSYVYPGPGDIETEAFSNKIKDGFTAEILLERFDESDSTWYTVSSNFTRGSSTVADESSIIRATRDHPPGLYRAGFHPAKAATNEMSYMMSLGLIPGLKGICIGKSISSIERQD